MAKPKVLILGAGFAGAAAAHLLKKKFEVTILEFDDHPGGGCWTQWYGGHPYTFGPRVFFTADDAVISLMNDLCKLRHFYTRTYTYVAGDGQLYNYPLQYSDIPLMPDGQKIQAELSERKGKVPSVENFESYWLSAIGPTLYGKFVDTYSKKMWGIDSNTELSAQFEWVNRGTPIRDGDDRLYKDMFQGYPEAVDGYNGCFKRALDGVQYLPNTRVTRFDWENRVVTTSKGDFRADIIINSLPVDYLFGLQFGKLRYCGRTFIPFVLPVEFAMPPDMTWIHYSGPESFTRITEFKKITDHKSAHTLLGMEIPDSNSRYYPVQSKPELDRYAQYVSLFPRDFYSIGRHGSFKYKGIPDALRDAIDVYDKVVR